MKHINTIYTMVFILICGIFTSTVLLYYSSLLQDFVPQSNCIREYLICFGQIVFQSVLLIMLKQKSNIIIPYLKNMMAVSGMGALLLLPLLIGSYLFKVHSIIYLLCFFVIVLFMFFNHKTRIKNIHAPWWLTYTWVLYRCIVLLIIS